MKILGELLASSSGRDKIVRTVSYVSLCASGLSSKGHAEKLQVVSSQLNHFRTVSRLFDDLAMLKCSLTYGLGSEVATKLLTKTHLKRKNLCICICHIHTNFCSIRKKTKYSDFWVCCPT